MKVMKKGKLRSYTKDVDVRRIYLVIMIKSENDEKESVHCGLAGDHSLR